MFFVFIFLLWSFLLQTVGYEPWHGLSVVMVVRWKFAALDEEHFHPEQHEGRRYEDYGQYHCFHCLLRVKNRMVVGGKLNFRLQIYETSLNFLPLFNFIY